MPSQKININKAMTMHLQVSHVKVLGSIFKTSTCVRNFYVGSAVNSVAEWRKKKGIPVCGKEYGPLRDLPDWSYSDGRPAPLSKDAIKRINFNKEYCEQIMKLSAEIDECLELNHQKAMKEEQLKQEAIKNRLKEKGEIFN